METNQAAPSVQPAFADRMRHSKSLIAIVAVLGVTVMGLTAALVVNRSDAQPGPVAISAPGPVVAASPAAPAKPAVAAAPVKMAVAPKPAPVQSPSTYTPVNRPLPQVVARSAVCGNCGTVEAVNAVKRQGQVSGVAVGDTTIGLGTVAGGLIGGLLGNQVGGGNGKTAATVLGVAGGAYAGTKVEQNMKSVTVYDVRVRMQDGSVRNLEVSSPVSVGAQVTVEGKNIRMATAAG